MTSIAQQVADEFFASKVTISLSTLAAKRHAEREDVSNIRQFRFADNSVLQARGKGRSLKVWVDGQPR